MRTYEEYKRILQLWEQGYSKLAISEKLDIPRGTVIDCIRRYQSVDHLDQLTKQNLRLVRILTLYEPDSNGIRETYAYVLGIYLGDGSISIVRKTPRLRITLDAKYPRIIEECRTKLQKLLPENEIGIVKRLYNGKVSCVDVSSFYKYWSDVLPQDAPGKKHERPIVLTDWQQHIVRCYPLNFFRGLYHSDGSRFDNVVNGKAYPRYQFTNCSNDIAKLFTDTCDRLGLHWTSKIRPAKNPSHMTANDIYISKRRDVEYLDRVIGPKA